MIYVWDNGGEYSDHSIHFLQCPELPAQSVLRFLELLDPEGTTLAAVEEGAWDWLQSGVDEPLWSFVQARVPHLWQRYSRYESDRQPIAAWEETPDVIHYLAARWKENPSSSIRFTAEWGPLFFAEYERRFPDGQ